LPPARAWHAEEGEQTRKLPLSLRYRFDDLDEGHGINLFAAKRSRNQQSKQPGFSNGIDELRDARG
jgi:hypothetical protein